jgi:hypothetical protein
MSTIFTQVAASHPADEILLPGEAGPPWLPTECGRTACARAEQRLEDLQARLACLSSVMDFARICDPARRAYGLSHAAAWGLGLEAAEAVFGVAVYRMTRDLGPRLLDDRSLGVCTEAWRLFEEHVASISYGELDLTQRSELTWTHSVAACALEWLLSWASAEAERQLGYATADHLRAA